MGWRNPLEQSEFEVHAECFYKLKEVYKNVRGEFHFKYNNKQAARFDLVLLNEQNELEFIIEVKSKHTDKSWTQAAKYSAMTGKPCIYVRGLQQALMAPSMIKSHMESLNKSDIEQSLRK